RMPTKEGLPLIEIWQGLGVNWAELSLALVQQVFEATQMGFVYLPKHFPQAAGLVPYRDQIGKRPPFATMELMWCPYAGKAHVVAGFVHPPTEGMFQGASELRGNPQYFTAVKGLEGSCDLPRDRTAIIGIWQPGSSHQRLLLHPRDYGFEGKEVALNSETELIQEMQALVQGKLVQGNKSELMQTAIWNGGFYLWHCGLAPDLSSGLTQAEALLNSGQVAQKLQEISRIISSFSSSVFSSR
ncbi:MAG: hypothetical protein AB1861_03800, partial [Cyanobacteriota bacterium]